MARNYTLELNHEGAPPCRECNEDFAELVTGEAVYPHREDLHHLKIWVCPSCEARVGAYEDGFPKGYPAGPVTRGERMAAHKVLDKIWKSGKYTRDEVYAWVIEATAIPPGECHIGMMDAETCRSLIQLLREEHPFYQEG